MTALRATEVPVHEASELLRVRLSSERDVLVVALHGELDLSTEQQVSAALDRAISNARGPVVVDLSGLDFCGVSGLACVLRAYESASRRGLAYALAELSPLLTRVWDVAFADRTPAYGLPPRYPTVTAAVDALVPLAYPVEVTVRDGHPSTR